MRRLYVCAWGRAKRPRDGAFAALEESCTVPLVMTGDNKPALVALGRRRTEVIEALADHFANDALSLEEYEERLELVHQATAVEQLALLLQDLEVVKVADAEPASQALATTGNPDTALVAQTETKKIRSILSNASRSGAWPVPRKLRVVAVLGEVKLDFRDVQLPPGITELSTKAILGNVEILVPPTLAVQCEGTAILGEFREMHRASQSPDPEMPLLLVTGRAILGELKIETRLSGESARDAKRRRKREDQRKLAAHAAEEQKRLTDGD